MKTLNLARLKKEFLMFAAFHEHKFCDEISQLEGVKDHVKDGFRSLVRDFMNDLFEMAELDNQELNEELGKNSTFFNSVSQAAK